MQSRDAGTDVENKHEHHGGEEGEAWTGRLGLAYINTIMYKVEN